jgi:lactate dehydrogenase-like 2-hydroxyacid dehydrogenase
MGDLGDAAQLDTAESNDTGSVRMGAEPGESRKPTVLLVLASIHGDLSTPAWQRTRDNFNIIQYDCPSVDEFCKRLKPGGPYSNIDAIFRTGWLKSGPYSQHLLFRGDPLSFYPPTLKYIGCCGHGYDAADIEALTTRGITYANTPNTNTEAVANTALHLILNTYRYFTLAEHHTRNDEGWTTGREVGAMAVDPAGQVLGMVGMGCIGLAIAKKAAAALGMEIHYHNRTRRRDAEGEILSPDGTRPGATFHDTFESLLEVADCICLACPLTDDTKHLISAAALGRIKDRKIRIVNIARGGLINEDDLLAAMDRDQVVGVGLDVHAHEPGINPKLKNNFKVTVLPHIGVASRTSWKNFDEAGLRNLNEFFLGDKRKVTCINKV